MSKAVSTALYLEFRRENHTAQVIMTPPIYNSVADKYEPARVLNRQISDENPRRPWKIYQAENSADLGFAPTPENGIERALPILNELSSFFAGFVSGGWVLYQVPLTIEMSQDDLNDLSSKETPNALIRRVLKARSEAKFSDDLWDISLSPTFVPSTSTPAV